MVVALELEPELELEPAEGLVRAATATVVGCRGMGWCRWGA